VLQRGDKLFRRSAASLEYERPAYSVRDHIYRAIGSSDRGGTATSLECVREPANFRDIFSIAVPFKELL